MKKQLFLFISLILLFISCKKEDIIPYVTPAMARDSLYYIMKEYYYWYNMPEATSITESNKGNYKDPLELLEAMRYRILDKWSFVTDYEEYMAVMEGTFEGHGIFFGLDQEGNARVTMIYKRSPLYASGVRRGWIMKKINDIDFAPVLRRNDYTELLNLLGPSDPGITNNFLFKQPSGNEITISSTKTFFEVNTVMLSEILELASGPTGHLVFESFYNPAPEELAEAFAYFNANGIKDLILDLRYNRGGFLSISQVLASYIVGNARHGAVFAKLSYNDKHKEANYTFPFLTTNYSLALPRLVIITSRQTASASEALINGVKPFVDVVTIGDTTDGKPYGMNFWDVDKKYLLAPVTFKLVNAENQGDYYDGFFPAKVVPDDITRDFNDREELCLKEAIYYLENGTISSKLGYEFKHYPVYSEKPKWMNNAFSVIK